MEFKKGQKVEHILNGDWLLVMVIDPNTKSIKCRTKNLEEKWFDSWELRAVESDEMRKM